VPPLWIQLADLAWPRGITEHLRYITNSGGRMPRATLEKLRAALPATRPFLMYGLTEAFRGTYLPPDQLDRRPDSIGQAIPNAEIVVVRPDGSACAPNEPGELVQRGSLVALGYWNDPAKTAERFKPAPGQQSELPLTEMAVWSGDTVRMDDDGFLYFVGRRDEMIKSSGYRISPTEVEEVVYASGKVSDAVAVGHFTRPGEAIVLVAAPPSPRTPRQPPHGTRLWRRRPCWITAAHRCRATWCRRGSSGWRSCRGTRMGNSTGLRSRPCTVRPSRVRHDAGCLFAARAEPLFRGA
jgi:acyl-CoA synthetase (AMP-forming)/AMP-acid ligase II